MNENIIIIDKTDYSRISNFSREQLCNLRRYILKHKSFRWYEKTITSCAKYIPSERERNILDTTDSTVPSNSTETTLKKMYYGAMKVRSLENEIYESSYQHNLNGRCRYSWAQIGIPTLPRLQKVRFHKL